MTQPQLDVRPFQAIPRWLVRQLRPQIEAAVEELQQELSAGGAPADDGEVSRARERIVLGMRHFCDLIDDPRGGWERLMPFYLGIGREMVEEYRELGEMHQVLRRSAQALWRALTGKADELDLDQTTLHAVADAQFAYMDAVSAAITAGYENVAQSSAEALQRRRTRLLSLLLAEPDADTEAVAAASKEARWPLPKTVAVAVVHPREDTSLKSPLLLPSGLLVDLARAEPTLLIPDPDGPGRTRLLEPLLRDWVVAIGPTVAASRALESLRWAQDALVLTRRGIIPDRDLIRAADHVPTLVIFRAEGLIDNAAAARLAPLEALPEGQRERLTETLLALLEHNFNATEASARLHVHPQTVRYRLRHLEELFGDDLQDPHRCLEIEMILHAKFAGARATGTRPGARPGSGPLRPLALRG
ncbi:helix-turn-helix domain-containing protein [Thermomonospora umbrina]|uniref:PucR-like helix-turn-helix protein n=1 Tax=Thermomonospora umbrina TaxID=111806 RepID=A0A3D9STK3_9ACTN|nr:helix-turn-helix domain-containing protein [Thermomonospora umbrina]REE97820.1 PucR-like helix-turn-helix protein [Thermomonospora umbrina]